VFDACDVTNSSEQLFQYVRERFRVLASHALDFEHPKPFDCVDAALLASIFQKAIRRGALSLARRAGHQLFTKDRQKLWRRLMTVALEDIGIGDPDIAVQTIAISTLQEARRLLGGDVRALEIALRLACSATKDRSGDHLVSLARDRALCPDDLKSASVNVKLAVLASSSLSWRQRLAAAMLVFGPSEQRAADRRERFAVVSRAFAQLGVPCALLAACDTYNARARDPLCSLVPLAWCLWKQKGACEASFENRLGAPCWIGELPDWAFDPIRTRLGTRAIDLWLRSYLAKPPFTASQVAAALWNIESATCARTLDWSFGRLIGEQAHGTDLVLKGVAAEHHEALCLWIEKERVVLTAARHAVWQGFRRDQKTAGHRQRVLEFDEVNG
jgi:hypothetical protein